jgi:hypothetical protein
MQRKRTSLLSTLPLECCIWLRGLSWTKEFENTFLPLSFSVPEQMACHDVKVICATSFVSACTLLLCTLKCVSAAAAGNPIQRLLPDQNVGPTLRHCQTHTNHLSRINRYVMRTILTKLWTGAHSSATPCSSARANSTRMPTVKCCPHGHLTQKHALGRQDIIYSAPLTHCTQMLCLSFHVADME